jgi:hypothetical protein
MSKMRLLSIVTEVLLGRSRSPEAAFSPEQRQAEDDWLTLPDAIACPRCGAVYLGETDPDTEPVEREDQEWEAIGRLAAECPAHPDYFVVGI